MQKAALLVMVIRVWFMLRESDLELWDAPTTHHIQNAMLITRVPTVASDLASPTVDRRVVDNRPVTLRDIPAIRAVTPAGHWLANLAQQLVDLPARRSDAAHVRLNPRPSTQDSEFDDRRSAGRIAISGNVRCSLGDIVDLSATGLRVVSRRALCGEVRFALLAPGLGVQLTGEVVWTRREGFRRHVVGVRFLDVDAHAATLLTRIASEHRTRRVA